MKSTWETRIEPVAVELTPAGRAEAERIKTLPAPVAATEEQTAAN